MTSDKTLIGLTGEYYVLAQLSARGLVAALSLGNTKGVDILVSNQETNKLFKVEVKTTTNRPARQKWLSNKLTYQWAMSEKHETIRDENLIYCFVHVKDADILPAFFLVPSEEVADYVQWQHETWLSTRNKEVKNTSMRRFRIEIDDPNGYQDNWDIFS